MGGMWGITSTLTSPSSLLQQHMLLLLRRLASCAVGFASTGVLAERCGRDDVLRTRHGLINELLLDLVTLIHGVPVAQDAVERDDCTVGAQ